MSGPEHARHPDAPDDAVDDFARQIADLGRAARRAGVALDVKMTIHAHRASDSHQLGEIEAHMAPGEPLQIHGERHRGRASWSIRHQQPVSTGSFDWFDDEPSLTAALGRLAAGAPADLGGRSDLLFLGGAPFHLRAQVIDDLAIVSPADDGANALVAISKNIATGRLERGRDGKWRSGWQRPSLKRVKTDVQAAAHLATVWLRAAGRNLSAHQKAAAKAAITRIERDGLAPVLPIPDLRPGH